MDPLQFVFAVAAIVALWLASQALRRRGYGDGGGPNDGGGDGDGDGGDGGD